MVNGVSECSFWRPDAQSGAPSLVSVMEKNPASAQRELFEHVHALRVSERSGGFCLFLGHDFTSPFDSVSWPSSI